MEQVDYFNFDKELLKYHGSKDKIKKIQNDCINYFQDDFSEYYYDYITNNEQLNVDVLVNKIVRTSRMFLLRTWYDSLNSHLISNHPFLDKHRFIKNFELLERIGYEKSKEIYRTGNWNTGKIYADYYDKEDCYCINVDGNHRTIIAKALDFDTIRIAKVNYYQFNKENFDFYKDLINASKKIREYIFENKLKILMYDQTLNEVYSFRYRNPNNTNCCIYYGNVRLCSYPKFLDESYNKEKAIKIYVEWVNNIIAAFECFKKLNYGNISNLKIRYNFLKFKNVLKKDDKNIILLNLLRAEIIKQNKI